MKQELQYWPICSTTNEVLTGVIPQFRGGIYHIPQNSLRIAPLAPKNGFAVIALEDLSGSEYIEDHRGKQVWDKNNATKTEIVNELGKIKDEFTDKEPSTQFDEWINNEWTTNESNQYIYKFNQVDNTRRELYTRLVAPFMEEARMKRLINTTESILDANEIETQALNARLEIQRKHPWPMQV